MTLCDRCGKETNAHTMSYFNSETICMRCDELEREHPAYEEARRVETEQVMRGNHNFPGIGLPADLRERSRDG